MNVNCAEKGQQSQPKCIVTTDNMETIQYFSNLLKGTIGPWGSPAWYVIGACAITIFLAKWATAIKKLLPFLGAFTLIGLALWAAVGLGIIKINL